MNSSSPPTLRRSKQPSIVDVAELAHVSSKTVSNVLHQRNNVKASTKLRVEQAIEALGYRPNLVSRRLRTGKSNSIILAVPELLTTYFSQLAHEVLQNARNHGYDVLIVETLGSKEREKQALSGLESCTADGVILSSMALTGQEVWENRTGMPVVLLGERSEDSPVTHVLIDNRASARQATEHVLSLGCKRPLFLGLNVPNDTGWIRMLGYRDTLESHGLPFREEDTLHCDFTFQGGDDIATKLLDEGREFDALICGNDAVAIGAMHRLLRAGLRVPEDVKVLGWDDSPEGRYANPSLTTVSMNLPGIAKAAVDAVLAAIDGQSPNQHEILFDFQLVARESTIGCNKE